MISEIMARAVTLILNDWVFTFYLYVKISFCRRVIASIYTIFELRIGKKCCEEEEEEHTFMYDHR